MKRANAGFSLVELMIAMTVTLIVSGAIYGLLTAGGNAFRREPELADRQQNIRIAMDLVSRDVFNAGAGLPTFSQVFTRTDPVGGGCTGAAGLNGCGVVGTLGAVAAATRAPDDGGDPSESSDVLEIVSTDEECPVVSLCPNTSGNPVPGTAGTYVAREGVPACQPLPGLVLLTDAASFVVQSAAATAAKACTAGGNSVRNGTLALGALLPPWTAAAPMAVTANPPPQAPNPVFMYHGRVIRYRIAPSGDPMDVSPALWRSESGRYSAGGAVAAEPGAGGFPGANSPWQLVARGIEDLQLEYRTGDPAIWRNQPPLSATNDWNSLVRQVRITLSARSSAGNLQGQSTGGAGGVNAVRGELTTTVAPRQAFDELQMCLADSPACPAGTQVR
jgi:prepilin-type N-terminal cleavage/methylation domain-containing protein